MKTLKKACLISIAAVSAFAFAGCSGNKVPNTPAPVVAPPAPHSYPPASRRYPPTDGYNHILTNSPYVVDYKMVTHVNGTDSDGIEVTIEGPADNLEVFLVVDTAPRVVDNWNISKKDMSSGYCTFTMSRKNRIEARVWLLEIKPIGRGGFIWVEQLVPWPDQSVSK
jgi:hypothetical protein